MEELKSIILKIKDRDENGFKLLLERMEGYIVKSAKLLYKDEYEDVYNELCLALWKAAMSIKYFDNDGQIITYLTNGVKQRYLELYRKSVQVHNNEICIEAEDSTFLLKKAPDSPEVEAMVLEWINGILNNSEGKTQRIYKSILVEGKSDMDIAELVGVSRQYVHRLRMQLREKYMEDNV